MGYLEIFIAMSEKRPIKENSFDTAQAGSAGAVSYGTGFGTFSSPDVSQNSAAFVGSKSLGPNSNTALDAPASGSQLDAAVDQIYSKSVTPSPDEVMTGLKYELAQMIKKDKQRAKEIVLNNLKQDPHYYGKLGMLNINDKEMMKVNPPQGPSDQDHLSETVRILNQMIEAKGKKAETPQSFKDALKDTRDRKNARYTNR
jgi:hypothetical protein